jgi:hypothetical protein
MNLRFLLASALVIFATFQLHAKNVRAFEFTDGESSVHLIILNINGTKVSGSVTKYIGGYESKLGKFEAKFEGIVLPGESKAGRKIEVCLKSNKHNLSLDKQNKAVWVMAQNGDLKSPRSPSDRPPPPERVRQIALRPRDRSLDLHKFAAIKSLRLYFPALRARRSPFISL